MSSTGLYPFSPPINPQTCAGCVADDRFHRLNQLAQQCQTWRGELYATWLDELQGLQKNIDQLRDELSEFAKKNWEHDEHCDLDLFPRFKLGLEAKNIEHIVSARNSPYFLAEIDGASHSFTLSNRNDIGRCAFCLSTEHFSLRLRKTTDTIKTILTVPLRLGQPIGKLTLSEGEKTMIHFTDGQTRPLTRSLCLNNVYHLTIDDESFRIQIFEDFSSYPIR